MKRASSHHRERSRRGEDGVDRTVTFCRLPEADKLAIVAYYVATSLKPELSTGHGYSAFEQALSLTGGSVAAYWRPTAGNFLGRIPRDRLLALGDELIGEQWAQSRHADKKRELAAGLERAFAEPEKVAKTPQQLERLKSWLPEGMAFAASDDPTPAKGKKRKVA